MNEIIKLKNQKPLTGTGYMWEHLLKEAGWNDLPEDKKYGIIKDGGKDYQCSLIYFPHCDMEYVLFSDEFVICQSSSMVERGGSIPPSGFFFSGILKPE